MDLAADDAVMNGREPVELAATEEPMSEKNAALQRLSSGEIALFELIIPGEKHRKFIIREQEGRIIGSSSEKKISFDYDQDGCDT